MMIPREGMHYCSQTCCAYDIASAVHLMHGTACGYAAALEAKDNKLDEEAEALLTGKTG